MNATRLLRLDDAPVLAELLRANRDFHAPWEPVRGEDYEGQRAYIRDVLEQHENGSTAVPQPILDGPTKSEPEVTFNNP